MYKKVELPQGFVGMEKEIANLWNARNVIKKNFDMNQDGEYFTFMMDLQQQMESHI